MRKREAAELIVAARRAAARVGKEFAVDRDKLSRFGGFSHDEINRIEQAADSIEVARDAKEDRTHA